MYKNSNLLTAAAIDSLSHRTSNLLGGLQRIQSAAKDDFKCALEGGVCAFIVVPATANQGLLDRYKVIRKVSDEVSVSTFIHL